MSESMRMWMEIVFNIAYLLTIWVIVILMIRAQPNVPDENRPVTKLFIWAFGLLALGDTGHVGFRVWAYAFGALSSTISVFGLELGNVPLMIQGFGVAYLILRDSRRMGDKPFMWVGVMILLSYAFYLPVILFVQEMPMIGMLMIPKTLAYVGIALIAYFNLFKQSQDKQTETQLLPTD